MNFISLDFETANQHRNSPCAVALTVIKNGEVSSSKRWLIRPHKENEFNPFNVRIHGITPDMVSREKEFDQIELYGFNFPEVTYLCSVLLAKRTWPGMLSYRLDCLARFLGFNLIHHDCASDATGAAQVVLKSANQFNTNSLTQLIGSSEIELGVITSSGYSPCRLPSHCRYNVSPQPECTPIAPTTSYSIHNAFYGKHVVFTGDLGLMNREEAKAAVISRGGTCSESISKKTNYLFVGEFSELTLRDGGKSSKLKKAEQLAKENQAIEILSGDDFMRLL